MTEQDDKNKGTQTQQPEKKDKDVAVQVTIDDKAQQILNEQLRREEAAKKSAEDRATKAEADKKLAEDAAEKSKLEAEDFKNKLGIIAEKQLEKKRGEVREKAKALLQDEERVKEIEEKLKTAEGVVAMEYTMNVLDQTLKKGDDARKKEAERLTAEKKAADEKAVADAAAKGNIDKDKKTPTGDAPLNAQQMGSEPATNDFMKMKFASEVAMIRWLRDAEKDSSNPELAAKAKVALDTLFKNWTTLVRDQYAQLPAFLDSLSKIGEGEKGKKPDEQPSLKEMLLTQRAKNARKHMEQGADPNSRSGQ